MVGVSTCFKLELNSEVQRWEMNAIELGRRLKAAREAKGMSQLAAAEVVAVPRTAITQMEKGNQSVSTPELTRFVALYGRSEGYFLGENYAVEDEGDALVALHRLVPGLEQNPKIAGEVSRCLALCREGHGGKTRQGIRHGLPHVERRRAGGSSNAEQGWIESPGADGFRCS